MVSPLASQCIGYTYITSERDSLGASCPAYPKGGVPVLFIYYFIAQSHWMSF